MTLFFDRNVGRKFPQALRLLGLDVVWHDERFGPTTSDEDWLLEAGRNDWVVITHDSNFVNNEAERRAVIDAQVRCLVMSGGSARLWDKARAIATSWGRIGQIIATEHPPYIWRRRPSGRWVRLYP